jgi:hypothetical protein
MGTEPALCVWTDFKEREPRAALAKRACVIAPIGVNLNGG